MQCLKSGQLMVDWKHTQSIYVYILASLKYLTCMLLDFLKKENLLKCIIKASRCLQMYISYVFLLS